MISQGTLINISMPVNYTQAQNTLVEIAEDLAQQAGRSGQADLATALTALSTEISTATPTDSEFWQGVATSWSAILKTAAATVQTPKRVVR